ncbi:hypothetical protein [Vibrio mediterranei]|uniref:hypothetical protein n=1 Tax=Vibrio mediterranei TaxID=689 RepID=UPI0040675A2A
MTLTLKYAFFRQKNATTGRLIELAFVVMAFSSIAALVLADNLALTFVALATALSCFAAFSLFGSAEKIRRTISERRD